VDLQPAFADAEGQLKAELTTDGIHLDGAGYRLWATVLDNEGLN
jgi:lysophospholipase L1-like esterase